MVHVRPSQPSDAGAIAYVILPIQQDEFGIPITIDDQPDLADVDTFYRRGAGNFWVAQVGDETVGTIALLDIGHREAALRKMFVAAPYRGRALGVAQHLLDTLLAWAAARRIERIYLGTTARFLAAHRFYEKNGFVEIAQSALPAAFPVMAVDTKFYRFDVPLIAPPLERRYGPIRSLDAPPLVLEPLTAAHAPEMFDVLSDPAIYEFENEPPASQEALARRYALLEGRRSPDGSEGWLNWVVRLPDGRLAGYVQATVLTNGLAFVAYELHSRHWRQGIATRAVSAVLDELRTTYGVQLFVAVLKSRNDRSLGLLRKLGFVPVDAAQRSRFQAGEDELVMLRIASPKEGGA